MGAITNVSRSFAAAIRAFVNNDLATVPASQEKIDAEIHNILYRHIAWLHVLRCSMGKRTSWEHTSIASRRQRKALNTHIETFDEEVRDYLTDEELAWRAPKNGSPNCSMCNRSTLPG